MQNRSTDSLTTLLLDVGDCLAQASAPSDAIRRTLFALLDHGWVLAAAVEVHVLPIQRYVIGDASLLDGGLKALEGQERVQLVVPVDRATSCFFTCAGTERCQPEGLKVVLRHLATTLDLMELASREAELTSQAERRIQEVSTIYEIGRAIVSDDIRSLLRLITEKAAKVMDAQACSLMRLDQDQQRLSIMASFGLSEDVVFDTQRALGEGIAGRVAATGEPLLILDSKSDPRLTGLALRPEIGSSMVVPMKDEASRIIGVLSIRRRRPAPDFNEDDLRLFSVFASQAALALSNKELYDKLSDRIRELSTLSQLTQTVISHLNLGALLTNVVEDIVSVVGFDRCCIYMFDRQARRFTSRAFRGYRQEVIANSIRMGEGVVGAVGKSQEPMLETDARNAPDAIRGFARQLGANSFLAVPMVSKGQCIGVVIADNKPSGRAIHPSAVELLTTFINQTALAIEIAQLSEEREQRFQQMNQMATQTDNILRSIGAAVVVVDTEAQVTRWNRASESMWGITEELAVGSDYHSLLGRLELPEEDTANLQELMRRVLVSGESYQASRIALHPMRRGEIIVNVLVSPLLERGGQRQGAVQIMEDISHDVRMEAEVSRMRRLADIGQLAAKMAHEVRNPLASIKGSAQILLGESSEQPALGEFLNIIIDEVNGLERITTDLLDFARPMQADHHVLDLNRLVERSLTLFKPQLEASGVQVETHFGEIPEAAIDGKQIGQVLSNTIINALQSMPDGGVLSIATAYRAEVDSVSVSIRDTGVGIPQSRFDEVFQPFFTTKTKGTGLGLAIVRKIVEIHGGSIEVESAVDQGTTFCITLPVRPPITDLAEALKHADPKGTAVEVPDA